MAKIIFDLNFPYVDASFHEKDNMYSGKVMSVSGYRADQRPKSSMHRIRNMSRHRDAPKPTSSTAIYDSMTSVEVQKSEHQLAKNYAIACPSSSDSNDAIHNDRGSRQRHQNTAGDLITVTEEEEESINKNSSMFDSDYMAMKDHDVVNAIMSEVGHNYSSSHLSPSRCSPKNIRPSSVAKSTATDRLNFNKH